jgi:hypothetical protein
MMQQYEIFWDEIVTYRVLVEADNADEARLRWCDPAYWDSEPEIECSDYTNDVEINEV